MLLSFTNPGVFELKLTSGETYGHISKFIFPSLNFKFSSNNGNVVDPSGFYSSYSIWVLKIVNAIRELYDNSLIEELNKIVSSLREFLMNGLNYLIGYYGWPFIINCAYMIRNSSLLGSSTFIYCYVVQVNQEHWSHPIVWKWLVWLAHLIAKNEECKLNYFIIP